MAVIGTLGVFQLWEIRRLERLIDRQTVQAQQLAATVTQVKANEQMLKLLQESRRLDDEQNRLVIERIDALEDVMKRRGVIFGEGDIPRIEVPKR